jgi:hypothetical protein
MLKPLFASLTCILITAPVATAQLSKPEVFVGYTNLQNEGLSNRNTQPDWPFNADFFRDRATLHGVNAAISAYGSHGVGMTGDFSWARRASSEAFVGSEAKRTTDVYYFMAGPTLKFNRTGSSRWEPFLRVMAGGAHTHFEAGNDVGVAGGTASNSFDVGSTDFAASAGGGLDIRLGERMKLRVIQVDYAPVFLKDRTVDVLGGNGVIEPTTLDGQRQDNFRFSFGITF